MEKETLELDDCPFTQEQVNEMARAARQVIYEKYGNLEQRPKNMDTRLFIIKKQEAWARRQGITELETHSGYVAELKDNLFCEPTQEVLSDFKKGAGGETSGKRPKMQALHSSSALAVNMFQYWSASPEKMRQIAVASGFCRKENRFVQEEIRFEVPFPVSSSDAFLIPPHLDVVIRNEENAQHKVYAVECKFSEPYTLALQSMKDAYFEAPEVQEQWKSLPKLKELAECYRYEKKFEVFDACQMIKHILGLKRRFGKKFRLLYLWHDAFGNVGALHRRKIDEFYEIAKEDKIEFHAMTYQELLLRLYDKHYGTDKEYLDYMMSRYL